MRTEKKERNCFNVMDLKNLIFIFLVLSGEIAPNSLMCSKLGLKCTKTGIILFTVIPPVLLNWLTLHLSCSVIPKYNSRA